jgi:hypothetical protein
LASPAAYEPPSVQKAWQAFLAHVPTILLIWVAWALISGVGFVVSLGITAVGIALTRGVASIADLVGSIVQLPFVVLSSLVGVLFVAVPALHYATGETIGVEQAFTGSFEAVYGSSKGWEFVGIQVLAFLVLVVVTVCTCGLGALVAVPVSTFYLQNAAYRKGVLS